MSKSNLAIYFSQRFPLVGVLFIASVVAFASGGLYRGLPTQATLCTTILITISFTAFLLRQRVVDEFKDELHDAINFPNRPFQQGIVNARTLTIIGILAFFLEIIAIYLAGGLVGLVWYIPVLLYSLLMMKEFFCSAWLEKQFTLYFIAHEIIFIFYGLWVCQLFNVSFDVMTLSWIIYFVSLLMSIEIGRKFTIRKDPKGRIVKDTYAAVWGQDNTITVLGLLFMIAGIALSISESSHLFALLSAISVFALYTFKRRDTLVKMLIVIHSILLVTAGIAL